MSHIVASGSVREDDDFEDEVAYLAACVMYGLDANMLRDAVYASVPTDAQKHMRGQRAMAKLAIMCTLRGRIMSQALANSGNPFLRALAKNPTLVADATQRARWFWHVYRHARMPCARHFILRRTPCADPVGHARCYV